MSKDKLKLRQRDCEACSPDTPVLKGEELDTYYTTLGSGWELVKAHHLEKVFSFDNFRQALDFTIKIGEMSEKEGHHPEINLTWGKVGVTIYTHVIDGLSENDFIWAAKADELYE